jgi:origin recognition complex subunit 1
MYNFFNWPALRHSCLIVLAVANTMDLPERTLSNKISSRLGLTRITFPGYTHTQLMAIISARLEGVPGNLVDPDAVQFAARKVAAVSGDARRALDICRRAVEIAEQVQNEKDAEVGDEEEEPSADTPSKRNRKQNDSEASATTATTATATKKLARVTIATIKAAIAEATSSPVAQCLHSLPLASKLFLAALLATSRRTGVADSTLGEVLVEAKRIADVAENSCVHDFLLVADKGASGKGNVAGQQAVPRVLAMGAAAMELVDAGIVAMEARARGERAGKVRLRVGEEEVKSALMGDAEVKGMGFNA